MAAEGLDVTPERGDLERQAVGNDGDRAVIDPCRHGLEPGLFGKRHHPLRLSRGGEIDLGDGKSEQRIAHGATHRARLEAVALKGAEHGARFPALQPLCACKRWSLGAALTVMRDHRGRQSISPGLMTPSSMVAG